ncbi:MAG TPA: MFS transporter, partial [Candidatus Dormibacteraeota bacterium]|nr:MFS transporter [Candidatus Dormibacteraeota bacterium]
MRGVNGRAVSLIALFLAGTALRPQLVGIAPLLPDIERSLRLSHAATGALTALPLVCMGAFAFIGVPLTRVTGSRAAVILALGLVCVGGILRGFAGNALPLFVATVGIGIGIAIAGTVLPIVVKETFAEHPVMATGTYAAGIQVGATLSAATAVPIALVLGGWHAALLVFAAFTVVVLGSWLRLAPSAVRPAAAAGGQGRYSLTTVLLALTFAFFAAAYYGLITWLPEIYLRRGLNAAASGGLIASLNASAMVGGFGVALLAGRRRASYRVVFLLSAGFAAAITGFVVGPGLAVVWAVAAGATNGALLPLVLALPFDFNPDALGVARATAAMQGAGYALAAVTPIAMGGVRD